MSNPLLLRKDGGAPIRGAMKQRGLSAEGLAAATQGVDVAGRGVSKHTIWKVSGGGATASKECRLRTAWLISAALRKPLQSLFDMPNVSTATVERLHPDGE